MKWNGEKLTLTGLEVVDSVLNNTLLGPSAARMVTSTSGHSAPFMVYDLTGIYQDTTVTGKDYTMTLGPFLGPDYGTATYDRKRFAFRKLDITYQSNLSGGGGHVYFSFQVRYETGGVWSSWTTIKSGDVQLDSRGSAHLFGRYTTNNVTYPNWGRMEFRLVTTNTNCITAGVRIDVLNTEQSANTAGEHVLYEEGTGTTRTSVLGATPAPPAWTRDPLWLNDKYELL